MGTWGNGPFDNDAALDLIAALERASDRKFVDLLRDSLRYESDLVAAGAILAGGNYRDSRRLALADGRSDAARLHRRCAGLVPEHLVDCVRAHLRVLLRNGSQLGWTDPKNEREYLGHVRAILSRLEGGGGGGSRSTRASRSDSRRSRGGYARGTDPVLQSQRGWRKRR